jgi:hypothetical protein
MDGDLNGSKVREMKKKGAGKRCLPHSTHGSRDNNGFNLRFSFLSLENDGGFLDNPRNRVIKAYKLSLVRSTGLYLLKRVLNMISNKRLLRFARNERIKTLLFCHCEESALGGRQSNLDYKKTKQ